MGNSCSDASEYEKNTSPDYEINYPGLRPWRPDEGWADSEVVQNVPNKIIINQSSPFKDQQFEHSYPLQQTKIVHNLTHDPSDKQRITYSHDQKKIKELYSQIDISQYPMY